MVGKEYEVLEVSARPNGPVYLRIASEQAGTPALFDTALFVTTDGRLAANWVARVDEGGAVRFGPAEWLERGFWEAYFDDDPAAVAAYERGSRPAAD